MLLKIGYDFKKIASWRIQPIKPYGVRTATFAVNIFPDCDYMLNK